MSWADYADAARQLAATRASDASAGAEAASAADVARRDLDRLDAFLAQQREDLNRVAAALKLPSPRVPKAVSSPETDVARAIHRAAEAANAANAELTRAEQAAEAPALLPTASPAVRAALIYGTWCMFGWIAQCVLLGLTRNVSVEASLWPLCGLPAIAFFGGYLTVATIGQPRMGERYPAHTRMGGLICFVGMPVMWIFLIAAFDVAR